MKQKIYILGVLTAITVFTGAIFKINHFPGAAVLLIAGIASLVLLFLPLALASHYRSAENRKSLTLYIVTYITCFVIFTSMLFKMLHWPYAGLLLTIALPFPYLVFLPVFVTVTSKDKNFDIYNTVFVLLLLALNSVFSGLLALNVTSNKVRDSFRLSQNYINQAAVLSTLPSFNPSSAVNIQIDEVLKSVKECQNIVLKLDNKTAEQWMQEPGNIRRPDIRGGVATSLPDGGQVYTVKLQKGLKKLIELMEDTPGYEQLAENAPSIFGLNIVSDEEWSEVIFNDFLAWVLIYLDGLEANLLTIKATGKY